MTKDMLFPSNVLLKTSRIIICQERTPQKENIIIITLKQEIKEGLSPLPSQSTLIQIIHAMNSLNSLILINQVDLN